MAAVSFQKVSKYFHRHRGQMLIRDRLSRLLQQVARERFYALSGVSFSVEHGDSLAVIGSNGAGKSTLLNIATGLCSPNEGVVKVDGRIAALLELGSGFHPDLTGAENIRMNAALLGFTKKETTDLFDSIIEFSGVGEFIDQPLRTYSSGTLLRVSHATSLLTQFCDRAIWLDHGQLVMQGEIHEVIEAYEGRAVPNS